MHNILENYIDYFIDNNIELTREQVEILYENGKHFCNKDDLNDFDLSNQQKRELEKQINEMRANRAKEREESDKKIKQLTQASDYIKAAAEKQIEADRLEKENIQKARKTAGKIAGGVALAAGAAYGGKKLYDYYKRKKLENKVQGK